MSRWYEARLLWTAKGWTIEGVAAVLQAQVAEGKRPELADFGLSESTVRRKTRTKSYVHPSFAQLVEELEPKQGHRAMTEIVEAGLRLVHDQPKDSDKQPQEIAKALLASFPTDEVAKVLAGAVLKRAARKGSPLAKLGRRMAGYLAKRLQDTGSGRIDTLQATLNHADAKIDVIDTKLDRTRKEFIHAVRSVAALGGIGALAAVCTCVAVVYQRSVPAPFVACAPTDPPAREVTVNVGACAELSQLVASVGPDGATVVSNPSSWLGLMAAQMGEKAPQEQYVPVKPFPGQKLPPCLAEAGERAINGGCWAGPFEDVQPPCGRLLYRSGNKCYRPVAADPQKPVGVKNEVQFQKGR